MLRVPALIAVLAVTATAAFVSPANAIVCSYDRCVFNCHRNGVSKVCLRVCDLRIARRLSSGLCPWYGSGDLAFNR